MNPNLLIADCLEVAVHPVPVGGKFDPCPEIRLRQELQLRLRPRDVEGPGLSEEIDSPPVERGMDPKWFEHQFARESRKINRGDREPEPWPWSVNAISNGLNEPV